GPILDGVTNPLEKGRCECSKKKVRLVFILRKTVKRKNTITSETDYIAVKRSEPCHMSPMGNGFFNFFKYGTVWRKNFFQTWKQGHEYFKCFPFLFCFHLVSYGDLWIYVISTCDIGGRPG